MKCYFRKVFLYRYFIYIGIGTFVFLNYLGTVFANDNVMTLKSNWSYWWQYSSNSLDSLDDLKDIKQWEKLNLVDSINDDTHEGDILWYKAELPEGGWINPTIYIELVYGTEFEIFVEEKSIFRNNNDKNDRVSLFIPLQLDHLGKTIYIKVRSEYERIGLGRYPAIGSHDDILTYAYQQDLWSLFLSAGFICIAIIIGVISVFMQQRDKRFFISLSCFIFSIGIISLAYSTNIIRLFLQNEDIFYYLFIAGTFVYFLSFTSVFRYIFTEKYKRLIQLFWKLQVFYLLGYVILFFLNVICLDLISFIVRFYVITVFGIMLAMQLIIFTFIAIVHAKKGDINGKIFTTGLLLLTITCLIDYILYELNHHNYNFFMWKWGVMLFIISLASIVGMKFSSIYYQLRDYSSELETKNNKLHTMSEMLRKQDMQLREITENTLDMVLKVNTDLIIQYVSPSHYKNLGYKEEELIGRSVLDLIHSKDRKRVQEILKNWEASSDSEGKEVYRCNHANGQVLWLETVGKFLYDQNEEKIGIIFSSRNVTTRVQMEESLKRSEERYRLLVELFPEAIIVIYEGKISFCNFIAPQYLGYETPWDILDRSLDDFLVFPNEGEDDFLQSQIKKKKIIKQAEKKMVRKIDGKTMDFEITAIPFPYQGKKGILVIIRDISERKKAEEFKLKMEEKTRLLNEVMQYDKLKTEFFANISHELRTPLNVILGALQMFELTFSQNTDMSEPSKMNKYLKTMKQNSYRLIRLINNLIDITKMEDGYLKLNLLNCNMVNIVEEITMSVVQYAENKGITLIFDTDVEEVIMTCDPDKIERIILNLLSNAIKFTDSGGFIYVSINKEDDDVYISIKDTGIGIPEEKQEAIFKRFIQVDKSFARNHEGSGIGLSLVESLVKMHKGSITVNSKYGEGSEFLIKLPIMVLEEKEQLVDDSDRHHTNIERIKIEFSDIYF